jgi:tetratricopeptide (TPR) repeat protein
MTLRYLSEFYTHRSLGSGLLETERVQGMPLERRLQVHLLRGDRAFAAGNPADALVDYRAAGALVPRFVDPLFPANAADLAERALLELDLTDHLISAAVQILRLRDGIGPDEPILSAADAPEELWQVAGRPDRNARPGERVYATALAHLRMGEVGRARRFVAGALWQSRRDALALADARNLMGALAVIDGNAAAGQEQFALAAEWYEAAEQPDGVAAMEYNRGVAAVLDGDYQEAVRLLGAAASAPFLGVSWQLSRSTLPGVASYSLLIEPPGLPLVARGSEGQWLKVASSKRPTQTGLRLVRDGAQVWIDLERGREAALVAELLQPRIEATTLSALDTHLDNPSSCVAHLAHVAGWVLPLSLGDAYAALGDYDRAESFFLKARSYRFLNRAIERPVLWRRLAETYLWRGKHLFASGRLAEARRQFRHVVPWGARDDYAFVAPLYAGPFAPYRALARGFRDSADPLTFSQLDYGSRIVLQDAIAHLRRLDVGTDRQPVPVGHAAATAAVTDNGVSGRDVLERLAREQEAALALEQRARLDAAARQSLLEQRAEAAASRLASARQEMEEFARTGSQAVRLVQASHWAKSSERLRPTAVRTLASRGQELVTLRGQIASIARAEADIGAELASAHREAANTAIQETLARLRLEQTRARLRYFDGRACMMEQVASARIALRLLGERSPVTPTGDISGSERLLAGEGHPTPLRATISLAERLPYQFGQQFRTTGRLAFETTPADVDHIAPGATEARVQRVAVEIDAPTANRPVRGVLTNIGVSLDRTRDGVLRARAHPPARMAFASGGSLAADEVARSRLSGERFAGLPVIGSWVVDLAPAKTGIGPRAIADVRLVIDFDAYTESAWNSDEPVAEGWHGMHEHALAFGVRAQHPRNFVLLRTTGAVSFPIVPGDIPADQAEPQVLDAFLVLDAAGRPLPESLLVSIASGAAATTFDRAVGADGVVSIEDGLAGDSVLRGRRLLDTWTVRIDRERNRAAFANGFSWRDIRDIYFHADYSYTPR